MGTWVEVDMGLAGPITLTRLAVGNGRGDGLNRVYAGDTAGNIYEYGYSASSWNKIKFNADASTGGETNNIGDIKIGNVRNGGLYAVGPATAELLYQSSAWSTNVINRYGVALNLSFGPGRHDGTNRLYVAEWGGLNEITYDNGAWNIAAIDTSSQDSNDVVVAQGRNDGIDRLYTPLGMMGGPIWEYTWNSTTNAFDLARCSTPSTTAAFDILAAGAGRNDAVQRIYAWGGSGLFEFSYSSGNWTNLEISSAGPNSTGTLRLADGRNDGNLHVYTADSSGVVEYSFSGSWSKTAMITSKAAGGLDIGNGRNDGVNRLYVTESYDVYEYTIQK
jgi:hypothetical protein